MFSCEFFEISKNTFFTEDLLATASDFFFFFLTEVTSQATEQLKISEN